MIFLQLMEDNVNAQVAAMDQFDFEYWAKHYEVSVEELKQAISEVGNSTQELDRYFKK